MDNGQRIKLLLVHDLGIVRQGLRELFESQPDIEVLDGVKVGKDVVQLAHELKPDVMVIDVNVSETNSIELSQQILNENPNLGIVALPVQLHMYVLEQAIRAGISGFVSLECSFDKLANAVRAVNKNLTYMCSKIRDIVTDGYICQMQADKQSESLALTEREYEITQLLSQGMTCKKVALHLDISSKTVDASRRKIMYKLRIDSMADLVKYAIRTGITSI
ncbi:MAG: LuxR C-terminal-related transcriptional regulator [Planctomycetota bacterium]|jgi:DNA-binding NarL/FixJ family response regulator